MKETLNKWIVKNNVLFKKFNIQTLEMIHNQDSAYCDFLTSDNIGRIVCWEEGRLEFEILDIETENQLYFRYFEFKEDKFDELLLDGFLMNLIKK